MLKAMRGIDVIQILSKTLPRHSHIAIHKSFVRPHLDHGDKIYAQLVNEIFIQKLKEFNTALLLQLLVPSKEHLEVSCTVRYVLNL